MSRPPRLGPRTVRLELGLFAFTPALLLLAFRTRHESLWWLMFALPAALGCLVAAGAVIVVRRSEAEPYTFADIEDASDDLLGHIGSYLLPVVIDFSKSTEEVIIAAIVLALIIHIHVATGRVHVNPILYFFGYRIYRASTDTGVTYYLVAHSDPAEWQGSHRCLPLADAILIEPRRESRPRRPGHRDSE